ncbi:MAG: EamA family transporter, partial [Nitrospirae bacterium]|nr:EamA family transporter [Nitrospirota bacterium]
MERLPVWTASTLLLVQPVMTFAEGWAVLGQAVTPAQVLGVVLALAGIRLANTPEARG